MNLVEVENKILSILTTVEEGGGNSLSREVYEKRLSSLNECIEILDDYLKEAEENIDEYIHQYRKILELKCRVKQSLRVLKLADMCGIIK